MKYNFLQEKLLKLGYPNGIIKEARKDKYVIEERKLDIVYKKNKIK